MASAPLPAIGCIARTVAVVVKEGIMEGRTIDIPEHEGVPTHGALAKVVECVIRARIIYIYIYVTLHRAVG